MSVPFCSKEMVNNGKTLTDAVSITKNTYPYRFRRDCAGDFISPKIADDSTTLK